MKTPYYIIEVANTHAGDINYLNQLIDQFSEFKEGFGMKFQPFQFDKIAAPDFSWYETYKQLYFTNHQWKEIIAKVSDTKDVWLDMFDVYSVEILSENISKIAGIKLQASVLYNFEMLDQLSKADLSQIKIQLNIAGYEMAEIRRIVDRISAQLKPQTFVIQFGFQNYPTEFGDSGLSKISLLKESFPEFDLCFADHLDGESEDALIMPLIAVQSGCTYIEKHVCFDQLETKYDKFSSLTYINFKKLVDRVANYSQVFNEDFLNERERIYLSKSLQIPILKHDLKAGALISFERDFVFRRTDQKGLNTEEIKSLLVSFHLLNKDKKAGEVLTTDDFRKAKKATIVACRMKSSRLPQKAILPIGKLSSIELCLKNLLLFKNIDHTILATSVLEEDAGLKDYTYSKDVIFHKGDPEDVIQRYLDIIDKLQIDVIMRVTGDCPYLSKDIHEILMNSHFEKGADYTTATNACIGLNVEVINTNTLKKIKTFFPYADYSEYMTYYVTNNPSYFHINRVELPKELERNYRLTLDYPEDLELFRKIEEHLDKTGRDYSVYEMFRFLDNNPELAASNKHCTVVYRDNDELIQRIKKATTIVS